MGFRTQTHQHHLLSLLLLHLLKHRPSLRLFQKDATLLISRIVFPLPLVQVINSAIKYGCPTEPRITALLWEENVLPTRLVAVDQPNVLVAAAISCIPPSDTTSPPTQSPTSPQCTPCDDRGTPTMSVKGKDCTSINLAGKCSNKSYWIKNKFCQLSCYNAGLGYDGDVCCNDTL